MALNTDSNARSERYVVVTSAVSIQGIGFQRGELITLGDRGLIARLIQSGAIELETPEQPPSIRNPKQIQPAAPPSVRTE